MLQKSHRSVLHCSILLPSQTQELGSILGEPQYLRIQRSYSSSPTAIWKRTAVSGKVVLKGAVMLPPNLNMAKQDHGPISICLSARDLSSLLCHGNPPKLLS